MQSPNISMESFTGKITSMPLAWYQWFAKFYFDDEKKNTCKESERWPENLLKVRN